MLTPNDTFTMDYTVAPGHTVGDILPEAAEFTALPDVFTTGCLLAIMEWACIRQLNPHLGEGQISLGVGMTMTHDAPCTTGARLVIECTPTQVTEKFVTWEVEVRAADTAVVMGRGTHTRAIVAREKFSAAVNRAAPELGGEQLRNP
ncbi:hypothetical protein C1Y63_11180 [Corynebacterium sp. 13CS0277]|uniref:thioesterase family protein n=1 Tax=Corynebacterium sp. 13CS0277 TaxID=2071994 RepID=UPI000D0414DB|nr:hotdog domain-containing protein [Corynebacterium sp. 13CS0277]PRQ10491.1 hypothetical protein C1Y63_11180 [Corynebacterium sp. 13CS0277]